MKIEKSFVVKSTPAAVWAFLTDPQRVARALPGAAIQEQIDPQTYTGTMTVKVGPVSTSYRGQVRFEQLDQAAGVAVIVATGQDVRGKGGADMRMTSRVVERAPGETEVNVVSDVNVSGILAQMGRGMIEQVSDQMFEIFTNAARVELEGNNTVTGHGFTIGFAQPAEPIEVVSFGSKLVGRAVGRAMRRPAFWAVVVAIVIVVVWLSRR
jgi:carbon monoxide dehydrogenase subunit G